MFFRKLWLFFLILFFYPALYFAAIDQYDSCFGHLSRSDMMIMDQVFLDFEHMTDVAIEAFEMKDFTTLEEVFVDVPDSEWMIEEIREHQQMTEMMRPLIAPGWED